MAKIEKFMEKKEQPLKITERRDKPKAEDSFIPELTTPCMVCGTEVVITSLFDNRPQLCEKCKFAIKQMRKKTDKKFRRL